MDFKLRTNAKFFTNEQILDDLKLAAQKAKKGSISYHEYLKLGTFSTKVFYNRFGSWNNALKKAGLSIVRESNISEKMLFENLEKVWRKLGRQPFYGEMKKPLSEYTPKPYDNRWGGWMKACEAFIKYKKKDPEFEKLLRPQSTARTRTLNEKIRLQILKRDNYKCQKCGRSPATHRELFLHVDHIKPFSKGGGNGLDNLQTLCNKCNLGKNNDENL